MAKNDGAGCAACRRAIHSAGWEALTRRAESVRLHARLWRCEACGAFWEENEREAHVIDEDAAQRDFPEAFGEA